MFIMRAALHGVRAPEVQSVIDADSVPATAILTESNRLIRAGSHRRNRLFKNDLRFAPRRWHGPCSSGLREGNVRVKGNSTQQDKE